MRDPQLEPVAPGSDTAEPPTRSRPGRLARPAVAVLALVSALSLASPGGAQLTRTADDEPTTSTLYIDPALQEDWEFLEDLLEDEEFVTDPETLARLEALASGPVLTRPEIARLLADPASLDDEALSEAMAFQLVLATDALAELDRFDDPDPLFMVLVSQIRASVGSDDADPAHHRQFLAEFGEQWPDLLAELELRGLRPSEQLWLIDDLAAAGVFADVERAEPIEPFDFVVGIADLALRNGEFPGFDDDPLVDQLAIDVLVDRIAPVLPAVQPSTTTTAPTAEAAPSSTTTSLPDQLALVEEEASDSLPIALAAGGGVLAMVAAAGAVVGLRRRSKDRPPSRPPTHANAPASAPPASPVMADPAAAHAPVHTAPAPEPAVTGATSPAPMSLLLDVNRRLTASLDPGQVAAAAVTESLRLLDADAGLLVRRSGPELVAVDAQPPTPFALDRLDRSALRRVVETGRQVHSVADDEAVLVRVPMAMAASAIVTDGRIMGALMVVRDPERPFTDGEADTLEVLAELTGSALANADTHGAATEVEPLTGLKNRRRLDSDLGRLAHEVYPDRDLTTAYLMVDVDHFKAFNDTNGHAAGDEALRTVAKVLRDNVRPDDLVYRYGGEEFAVLLPNSSVADAAQVAERLRAAVEACAVPGAESQPLGRLTVSIGAADTVSGPVEDLVERADAALYEAKHEGRNQVRSYRGD